MNLMVTKQDDFGLNFEWKGTWMMMIPRFLKLNKHLNLDYGNDMINIMKDGEQSKTNPKQLCKDELHGDGEFKILYW